MSTATVTETTDTTSTPDLSGYHRIHAALRVAPHRLAAAARELDPADPARSRAISRYWHGYAGEVHLHHTVEDVHFFPALIAKVPATKSLIARTDAEHHELDGLTAACDAAVARVVAGAKDETDGLVESFDSLACLMDGHLDFEDREILPVFQECFSAEEYRVIDAMAVKAPNLRQAFFTVPFMGWSSPQENWAQMLADAPAGLRLDHVPVRRVSCIIVVMDEEPGAGSVVLNIIWVVFSGFWLFLGYLFAGALWCITIIGIPFGLQAFKLGVFALWPFGRAVVKRPESGGLNVVMNLLWVLLSGIWLAIGHVIAGVVLCLTIIGIPLGLGNFKLVPLALWPFGRDIVQRGSVSNATVAF